MKYVEFTAEDFELALAEDRRDMKIDSLISLMAVAGMVFIILIPVLLEITPALVLLSF